MSFLSRNVVPGLFSSCPSGAAACRAVRGKRIFALGQRGRKGWTQIAGRAGG